jgi:hypothetical protein
VYQDNLFFKAERGSIGYPYGTEMRTMDYGQTLNPSPPNSENGIELQSATEAFQHHGYVAVDDHDDPPPYSPSAAAAVAALQGDRDKEMFVNMHRRGLQSVQYRENRINSALYPISGDMDDEYEDIDAEDEVGVLRVPTLSADADISEGEVQEIHVNDMSSSGGEGDVFMGTGSEHDPLLQHEVISSSSKTATTPTTTHTSVTADSAGTSPAGPTSGLKRSLEE